MELNRFSKIGLAIIFGLGLLLLFVHPYLSPEEATDNTETAQQETTDSAVEEFPTFEAEADEYTANVSGHAVFEVAEGLEKITRLKITPNEEYVFIAQLDGTVRILRRDEDSYTLQDEPFYKVDHGFSGNVESGLTGIILSANYATNNRVFLNYGEKSGERTENKVLRLKAQEDPEGNLVGRSPETIFTSNDTGLAAHQIQGGAGIRIDGIPHIIFPIGEGFEPELSQDPVSDIGKIILIQEDGDPPTGIRPFPANEKIQIIGIRNAFDLTVRGDTLYFTGNGPEKNDRLVKLDISDLSQPYNLQWDGTAESMITKHNLHTWEEVIAPTDIIALTENQFGIEDPILISKFSTSDRPEKEILVGTDRGESIDLSPIVSRVSSGGNLLGLDYASESEILFFGDFFDGKIYALVSEQ